MFTAGGIPAVAKDLWPDALSSIMNSGRVPFGRRVFARLVAPPFARHVLNKIPPQGIAWILGPAVPMGNPPRLELALKKRGGLYIFHVIDDWFSLPHYREMALQRCRLADLIIVPTEILLRQVRNEIPNAKVVKLEEPIDVDRVSPTPIGQHLFPPRLVWVGNPHNLRLIGTVSDALHTLSKSHDFILRIISARPPETPFPFRTEWLKYSYQHESALLAGTTAGLSPLDDTPYNRAKGIYKVKTYMAAGIPIVGSNIGYQKELVEHGKSGFLCESDIDWVANLSALLSNPSLARRMGSEARSVAVSRFSHVAVRDSWVSAVRSLYDETPRSD